MIHMFRVTWLNLEKIVNQQIFFISEIVVGKKCVVILKYNKYKFLLYLSIFSFWFPETHTFTFYWVLCYKSVTF